MDLGVQSLDANHKFDLFRTLVLNFKTLNLNNETNNPWLL